MFLTTLFQVSLFIKYIDLCLTINPYNNKKDAQVGVSIEKSIILRRPNLATATWRGD